MYIIFIPALSKNGPQYINNQFIKKPLSKYYRPVGAGQ